MSIVFDTGDKIDIPFRPSLNPVNAPAWTVLWVGQKSANCGGNFNTCGILRTTDAAHRAYFYANGGGNPRAKTVQIERTYDGTKSELRTASEPSGWPTAQTWMMFCLIDPGINRNPYAYYVDLENQGQMVRLDQNAPVTQTAGTTGITSNTSAWEIGQGGVYAGTDSSALSLVAAWKRELSPLEVRQQSIHPHPTDGSILFFDFSDKWASTTVGATHFDRSGYNNHGTLSSAVARGAQPKGFNFHRPIVIRSLMPVAAVGGGRIMSSLANAGGLAGHGGIAGRGGGLAG